MKKLFSFLADLGAVFVWAVTSVVWGLLYLAALTLDKWVDIIQRLEERDS